MGFLYFKWSPAKMYPVTGSVAFTICDEYYQAAPRAKTVAKAFSAYAKSRTQLKICSLPYRVTYFWLYLMIDFKYKFKFNMKHFVKSIYTFPEENILIHEERFCFGVVVTKTPIITLIE